MAETTTIDTLTPDGAATVDHVIAAMKDGETVNLSLEQILALISAAGIPGDLSVLGDLSLDGLVNPGYGLPMRPVYASSNMVEFRTLDDKRVGLMGVLNENSFLIRLYNPETGAFRNGLRFYLTGALTYDDTTIMDGAGYLAAPLGGGVTGTTQAPDDNSKKVATTEYVDRAVSAAGLTLIESGTLSMPAVNSYTSWAHGVGSTPKLWAAYAVCKTAVESFQIGDEVPLAGNYFYNGAHFGVGCTADATELTFSILNTGGQNIVEPDGTGSVSVNSGNFDLVFRVWS